MANRNRRTNETFVIKVLGKENGTWQGSVIWTDKQQTKNFRSALELLKMLDNILEVSEGGLDEEK